MVSETLADRRKWYRFFPEGPLEFAIVTRVLALMMLMALTVVSNAQRPLVLVVLAGMLWMDYVLLLSWVVQVGVDLQSAMRGGGGAEGLSADWNPARRRTTIGIIAMLPSVAAFVALVPWGSAAKFFGVESASLSGGLPTAGAILFAVLFLPAFRALKRAELGSPLWTGLVLVPIVHWFALHRLASRLDSRIRQQLQERGERKESQRDAGLVVVLADATWVLALLPWAGVVVMTLVRGWPSSGLGKMGPVCGTCLAAVFAIVNLAALEHVQSKIVALIRKA